MHFTTVTSSALYALVMAGVVVGAPPKMHHGAAKNATADAGADAVNVQDTITAWQ